MTFGDGMCSGEFLAPSVDAETRICTRCGAEIDRDDERLARGLGQHRMMPTVARGDIPVHLRGREGRVRVPINVMDSVPKHDPVRIYAIVELGLWERLAILVWGRVRVETVVQGLIRVGTITHLTSAAVPDLLGRMGEPAVLRSMSAAE